MAEGRRRRAVAACSAVLAVLLLLFAFGYFPQEPVRSWLEARLRQATSKEARIGGVRLQPGRLQGTLVDVVVVGPFYRLEIPRAEFRVAFESLTGPRLVFDRLVAERPRLELRRPAGPSPETPAWSGPLVVHTLRVDDLRVVVSDPDLGPPVVVDAIDVAGSVGEGTVSVDVQGARWPGLGPEAATANARLRVSSALEVALDELTARYGEATLTASGPLGRVGALKPDLQVAARGDVAVLAPLLPGLAAAGVVQARGRLFDAGSGLTFDGDVTSRSLRSGTWLAEDLTGTVRGTVEDATVDVSARALGGRVAARARRAAGRLEAEVELRGLDAARAAAAAGTRSPVAGTVSGALQARGPLDALEVTADLTSDTAAPRPEVPALHTRVRAAGTVRGSEAFDVQYTVELDERTPAASLPGVAGLRLRAEGRARGPAAVEGTVEGTVTVDAGQGPEPFAATGTYRAAAGVVSGRLALDGAAGRLELEGELAGGRFRALRLRGDRVLLARLVPDAKGEATLRFEGEGAPGALDGRGHAALRGVESRGVTAGDVEATVEVTKGRAHATVDVPRLSARARVTAASGSPVTGTLTLQDTPLEAFAALFPEAARGTTGRLTAEILGIVEGERREAEARVDALHLRREAITVEAAPFTVRLAGDAATIEDLHLRGEGATVDASGRVALSDSGPVDLTLRATGDLARLGGPELRTGGTVTADVRLRGTRLRPEPDGEVHVDGAWLERPGMPRVDLAPTRVTLDGSAATLAETRATMPGGEIRAAGRIPAAAVFPGWRRRKDAVAPDEGASLEARWEGFDVRALLASRDPEAARDVEAALTGHLRVEGGLASLQEVRASAHVDPATVRIAETSVQLSAVEALVRDGHATLQPVTITTEGGSLRAEGSADLGTRALEARGEGRLDLRALAPLVETAALTGTASVDARVTGTLDAPQVHGSVDVADASVRLRTIPQAVTDVQARLTLEGRTVRLDEATGRLGGGRLTARGHAQLAGTSLGETALAADVRDAALAYPYGLRSRVDADVTLSGAGSSFLLSGDVTVRRGVYDLYVALGSAMEETAAPADSALLRGVTLAVEARLAEPVRVSNNLAQASVTGGLVLRGDLERPAPYGRAELAPGGTVFIQGREFRIESGGLVYDGTWDPRVALTASRSIRDTDFTDYRVTVLAEGSLENPALRFRTDPPTLSESQTLSLVAYGSSRAEGGARALVGAQAAAMLGGRLGGSLRGLGIDEVTIRPELVAREGDPGATGARFTFLKRLGGAVDLVYSQGLQGADTFTQVEARPLTTVKTLAQRQDDGTYTLGAGQRLGLGGAKRRESSTRDDAVEVTEVRLETDRPQDEAALRAALETRAGRRSTPWEVQDDAARVRERLRRDRRIEAEVSATLEGTAATFRVRSGPRFAWRVEGLPGAPSLDGLLDDALFEQEALAAGEGRLLAEARRRGHLRARVATRVEEDDDLRTLVAAVEPGPRYARVTVTFPGASEPHGALADAAGGAGEILTRPDAAVASLRQHYRRRHHRAARIGTPVVAEDGPVLRVTVPVEEGPRARVTEVSFPGATRAPEELLDWTGLAPGQPHDDERVRAAVDALRDRYLRLGHADVRVVATAEPRGADLAVVLAVDEGPARTVADVHIEGLRRTAPSLVRRRVGLAPGQPLDPRQLGEVERRLFDLGLFARVTAEADAAGNVRVRVEEGDRLRTGYDVRWNDDRGTSALGEVEARDLMRLGAGLGARYQVGPDLRDLRLTAHLPFGLVLGTGNLTLSAFRVEEDLPTLDDAETNTRLQKGLQVQHTLPLRDRWNVLLGYRFKRTQLLPLFPLPIDVAGLDVSLVRDTRDNVIDAHRGRFLSLSVELAPSRLGSDFTFLKSYAQVFASRPLSPSLTWAQGYRVGAAHGFRGQRVRSTERFFAGGATSVRGYVTDELGDRDFLGAPEGGEATIVLNQEIRWRPAAVGAVLFWDAGNVFPTAADLSLDLRHALGFGLRWLSPVGLLRFDLGFPLGRREGEGGYQWSFGIGQAF